LPFPTARDGHHALERHAGALGDLRTRREPHGGKEMPLYAGEITPAARRQTTFGHKAVAPSLVRWRSLAAVAVA